MHLFEIPIHLLLVIIHLHYSSCREAWDGPYLPALRHLNLRNTQLSDIHLAHLLPLWRAATGIEHIDLADIEIGLPGITNLTDDLLEYSTSLRHLDLGRNYIGPRGAQRLGLMLEQMPTLQYLSLQENDIENEGTSHVLEGLRLGRSKLTTLRLSYTGIRTMDFWAQAIQGRLMRLTNLTDLGLKGVVLGDRGASVLATLYRGTWN